MRHNRLVDEESGARDAEDDRQARQILARVASPSNTTPTGRPVTRAKASRPPARMGVAAEEECGADRGSRGR